MLHSWFAFSLFKMPFQYTLYIQYFSAMTENYKQKIVLRFCFETDLSAKYNELMYYEWNPLIILNWSFTIFYLSREG